MASNLHEQFWKISWHLCRHCFKDHLLLGWLTNDDFKGRFTKASVLIVILWNHIIIEYSELGGTHQVSLSTTHGSTQELPKSNSTSKSNVQSLLELQHLFSCTSESQTVLGSMQ